MAISHYDVLGVNPSASQAEIRAAYRSLARIHHPDQRAASESSMNVSMAELNEAYRVLREPASRARYDADERLRRPSAGPTQVRPFIAPARARTARTIDNSPARYPWKLVAGMATVGCVVVIAGAALFEPADPKPPDNLLQVGSCVAVEPNNDVREVNCADGDDLVVREVVPMDGTCQNGLTPHRDDQGLGIIACVSIETG